MRQAIHLATGPAGDGQGRQLRRGDARRGDRRRRQDGLGDPQRRTAQVARLPSAQDAGSLPTPSSSWRPPDIANGFKTNLGFSSTNFYANGYAEVAQAQLKQIGIDATLQPWDNATFTQRRVKPDFEIMVVSEASLASSRDSGPRRFLLDRRLREAAWHQRSRPRQADRGTGRRDRSRQARCHLPADRARDSGQGLQGVIRDADLDPAQPALDSQLGRQSQRPSDGHEPRRDLDQRR